MAVEFLASKNYSNDGVKSSEIITVPLAASMITLLIARDQWTETKGTALDKQGAMRVWVELSLDGGKTWIYLRGCGASGGVLKRENGELITHVKMGVQLFQVDNPLRLVKVHFENYLPIKTKIDVEFGKWQ